MQKNYQLGVYIIHCQSHQAIQMQYLSV